MEVGKEAIVQAIRSAEEQTSGEIRVHLSTAPDEHDIFTAARQSFEALKMHATRDRNGILLYFNVKLHKFAVYGDEGIHRKVGQEFWERVSREITDAIHSRDLTAGIVQAVHHVGQALQEHFPARADDRNELHNDVTHSS